MSNKKILIFLTVAALFTCSLLGGGCGGSSSSVKGSNLGYILGTVDTGRVAGSNLYSLISQRIVGSVNVGNSTSSSIDIGGLKAGDILFLADASKLNDMTESEINEILDAYFYEGVALVAIYPDSEDVSAMSKLISVNLIPPVSNDGSALPNPHYEYLGASHRFIGDEGGNTFLRPMVHEDNEQLLDETYEVDGITFERKNYSSSKEYATAIWKAMGLTDEIIKANIDFMDELARDYRVNSVNSLFTWAAGIDQAAQDMEDEFSASVEQLKAAEGDDEGIGSGYKKLTGIAEGVTTPIHDYVNKELTKYFEEYKDASTVDGDIRTFLYQCGFGNYSKVDDQLTYLKKAWGPGGSSTPKGGIRVHHNTDTDCNVIGFHSFKDGSDYYLIKTHTITQPADKSLFISAMSGTRTSDLLRGGDNIAYHYGLIFGGNRGFTTKIYTSAVSADRNILRSYIPSKTANNNTVVTDTHSFSIGGGVSIGGMGGWVAGGPMGMGGLSGGFNAGVQHTNTKQWAVKDYTVAPAVTYNSKGVRVAAWDLNVSWPEYLNKDESWKLPEAFHRSVTLDTEAIWQVPPFNRKTLKFWGQTDYILGFCWAHKMPSQNPSQYNVGIRHSGKPKELTVPIVPLIGIDGAVQSGSKEGYMYAVRLYSDQNWTAETKADWISLPVTEGYYGTGVEFNYVVAPNNTGKPRVGYITITTPSGGSARIRFTQSPF